MKPKAVHPALVSLFGMVALSSCTSSPVDSDASTVRYARYLFVTPYDTGVLEVTAKPPSVCYSTQSDPARPITLIDESNGHAVPVASYRPPRGQYCDRQISQDVVARLIAHPSSFVVRWSPQTGQPIVETRLRSRVESSPDT
jgi:hypothetical protein